MNPLSCEEVAGLAPELALGVLDGSERARVLGHLETCDACRRLLDDLATTIGRVVAAAPGIDPPPGFERQVLAQVAPVAVTTPVRRRRRFVVVVAAVATAAAVTLAAFLFTGGGDGPLVRRATITAAADGISGDVLVVDAHPTWVTMRVNVGGRADAYHCEFVLANGHVERLGTFHDQGGVLEWGGTLNAAAADVVEARLVEADGTVAAVGHLN